MVIKKDPGANAAMTNGKGMTLRDFAQGAWRMRGLGIGQRLHVLIPPEIRKQVDPESWHSDRQMAGMGREQALVKLLIWLYRNQIASEKLQGAALKRQVHNNLWREKVFAEIFKSGAPTKGEILLDYDVDKDIQKSEQPLLAHRFSELNLEEKRAADAKEAKKRKADKEAQEEARLKKEKEEEEELERKKAKKIEELRAAEKKEKGKKAKEEGKEKGKKPMLEDKKPMLEDKKPLLEVDEKLLPADNKLLPELVAIDMSPAAEKKEGNQDAENTIQNANSELIANRLREARKRRLKMKMKMVARTTIMLKRWQDEVKNNKDKVSGGLSEKPSSLSPTTAQSPSQSPSKKRTSFGPGPGKSEGGEGDQSDEENQLEEWEKAEKQAAQRAAAKRRYEEMDKWMDAMAKREVEKMEAVKKCIEEMSWTKIKVEPFTAADAQKRVLDISEAWYHIRTTLTDLHMEGYVRLTRSLRSLDCYFSRAADSLGWTWKYDMMSYLNRIFT
jgi:hypothetical protein